MISQEVPLDPNPAHVICYEVKEPFFSRTAVRNILRTETELFGEVIDSRTGTEKLQNEPRAPRGAKK